MNKTRSFLRIILSLKDSAQQQIYLNGAIFENKCCRCNKGSLYSKSKFEDKAAKAHSFNICWPMS